MSTAIYALADSRGQIRYIGATRSPLSHRVSHHITESKFAAYSRNQRKDEWIRSLGDERPTAHVLLHIEDREADFAERTFIAAFRDAGHDLVNLVDGGSGNVGWEVSDVTRERMSKAKRGKKMPPEAIAKTAAANRGRKLTEEHLQKLRDAHKRRGPITQETRDAISAAQLRRRARERGEP